MPQGDYLKAINWTKENNWTIHWGDDRVKIEKDGDEYSAETIAKAVTKAKAQFGWEDEDEPVYRTLDVKLGVKTTDRVLSIPQGQEITVILGTLDDQTEVEVQLMHAEIFERVAMPNK